MDRIDDEINEVGQCEIGIDDGAYSTVVKSVTGKRAVFFVAEDCAGGFFANMFKGRRLFDLVSFVFVK